MTNLLVLDETRPLPPPPFLPPAPVQRFERDPPAKKCSMFGGGFKSSRNNAAVLAGETLARSGSQGRLATAGSRPVTGMSRPVTGMSRPVTGISRPFTGSSSDAGNDLWELLAPMAVRDHVGNLLQQPLPSKGENIKDYTRECSIGALPVVPEHVKRTSSTSQTTYVYNADKEAGTRAQKASDQWRGFPKNSQSEFNEQSVKQKLIMRK
mmetsp:Transcript_39075/g.63148  ORF Transcript_39075/g.63148 Transcript_39075/m.63148 type:complete len:209 (-) Transcript_39075:99-725(-)